MAKRNLLGMVFGRLTVIGDAPNTHRSKAQWLCRCECGVEKIITSDHLTHNTTKSCGCLKLESRNVKHGMSRTKYYHNWSAMIQRCTNPNHKHFHHYGGRGITVCDRWLNSFENFFEDMGDRPEGLELERIDNDKGYCKENCKWITRSEQNQNRRISSKNTSGKTGVYWYDRTNQWKASITLDRKVLSLGYYDFFEDAVEARQEGELKYFGKLLPH